jgi:2-haloacid dehalogenase
MNPTTIGMFAAILAMSLGITVWAARRTRTTADFYAAGKGLTAAQNGFALAGDWCEAKNALGQLKRLGGRKLAILSNGSTDMLSALVKNSGFDVLLDAVISVDGARKYKPHPDCYALVEKTLGVKKDEVIFVSSNSFDVAGAKRFGFKVVWIQRGGGPGVAVDPVLPAQMYRLLRGRAECLGYVQDGTVSALTDLSGRLGLRPSA